MDRTCPVILAVYDTKLGRPVGCTSHRRAHGTCVSALLTRARKAGKNLSKSSDPCERIVQCARLPSAFATSRCCARWASARQLATVAPRRQRCLCAKKLYVTRPYPPKTRQNWALFRRSFASENLRTRGPQASGCCAQERVFRAR